MTDNSDKTSVQLWPWQKRALDNGQSDMRRLIHMRNSGESWAAISAEFPGRTLQGVKQTYRKRRFATERQMEREAFAVTSAEPSLMDDDDEKRNHQDEALAGKGTQAGANAFARRPWLSLETSERPSANRELSGAAQDPNQAEQSRDLSYRFWEESELRRLIEMRSGGAKWSAIAKAFPDHTSEALKQTYHKRRHAEEQKIEEEKASDKAAKKD
ncbi:hypothetical protein LZL87_007026 [Fusarium oxysporum]|nr:hypothetical protein LZL87_007026 [Fusarium oxysporum]